MPTLWSAAHAAHLSTASVGWPVTADAQDIDFLIPEYWRGDDNGSDNPDDRFLISALSRPFGELDRIASRVGTPYMKGNEASAAGDEIKTLYELDILRQHKPQFMTVHLSSLDTESHSHGPFSPQVDQDLEQLDAMVGRLIAQERANDPAAIVVIVSDHGFAHVDKYVNLGAAFIQAGLIQVPAGPASALSGHIVWQSQPWAFGGMFAIMLHDPHDVAVKATVKALLDKLAAQPDSGIEAVLDAAQVAALGGAPEAAFVVTLRKGYVPGGALKGDLVTAIPGAGDHGTHGYNPQTTPEMRASFFAAGPAIAPGKDLGIIDMRRIAPTLAQLLGIQLPSARQQSLPLN